MRNKSIWFIALLLLFVGCYEDKGNYSYSESNSITIDLGDSKYTAVAGETINIEPVFTFALDSNESNLTYEWQLGGQFLSDKRNLSYYVDTIMRTQCVLRVFDNKSGITYIATTEFELTEKYNTTGWMILSENGGTASFSYMRETLSNSDDFSYIESPDVYALENHVALGGKPVQLLEHFSYSSTSSNTWVLLGEAETVDLSGLSFKKEMTLSESFLDGLPTNFTPTKMAEMRWVSAVINGNDGKVYTRIKVSDKSYYTGAFLNTPLTYKGKELYVTDFVIAPFMGPGYTLMVEGEKGHQRYLALIDKDKSNAGNVLPLTVKEAYPANFTPLDDLGEMEVIYTGYYRGGTSNSSGVNVFCSILKDPDGDYYFQEFSIAKMNNASSVVATPVRQVKFDVAHLVDENTIFNVAAYRESNYMLISRGTDLYYVNRLTIGTDGMLVKLYKHFDANITAMDSECFGSKRLGVGLANGQFFVLNMEKDKGIIDEAQRVMYESENNFGTIKDIRYKIKSGNSWQR